MNDQRPDSAVAFKLTLKRAPAPEQTQFIALEKWRAIFFRLGLIGEYPNENIGYGNLSSRIGKKSFIITGSQTGHLAHLQAHHYTRVIDGDLKKQSVTAEGLIPPSSAALTHFELYEANSAISSIFHVHNEKLWDLLQCSDVPGLRALDKPEDGILSFAGSAEEAGKIILELYRKLGVRQ